MKTKYLILLNNSLKKHILNLNEKERKKLRDKFEYLENGLWDSGIRVKKLKGIYNKVIFEGRVDKSQRILFTIGKIFSQIGVYVWGIVNHNDISKKANIITPENAPFLHFEQYDENQLDEIVLDDLNDDYYTQESIEEIVKDDYGPQKWLVLNDDEWFRFLQTSKNANELESFLYLTGEQRDLLNKDLPLLLSGTAGSGKTTISVYMLLKKYYQSKRRLFLTYNKYLKTFSEKIYNGLIVNTDIENNGMPPEFHVFNELLLKIAKDFGVNFAQEKKIDFAQFKNIFNSNKYFKKYDSELVWEEIRSIIKGGKPQINASMFKKNIEKYFKDGLSEKEIFRLKEYLIILKNFEFYSQIENLIINKSGYNNSAAFIANFTEEIKRKTDKFSFILNDIYKILEKKINSFSSPLLSFSEYMLLGKKRAPNFLFNRNELYEIAQFYQEKIAEKGCWDELDLCRKTIELVDRNDEIYKYDIIICDEIQDFTDLQIFMIFRLANKITDIMLTGDVKQIINPSGFRWGEVKSKFFERGINVPDVYSLNMNFRCVGNIVSLSNALLDIKQKLVGISSAELHEKWKFKGKPPILIHNVKEDEIIKNMRITAANQIIVTRSEEQKLFLKNQLQTELIFTIQEVKGLEFETVLIWKFSENKKTEDIWRRIKNDSDLKKIHSAHIKYEINLLYVAVTRSRNTLIFYDGADCPDIWDVDEIKPHIFKTTDNLMVSDLWTKISKPSEWESQGDYFFERDYYPAAFECFKNSGAIEKMEKAFAFIEESKGHHLNAAKLFHKYNYIEKAANNYELGCDYYNAHLLWKNLKNKKRAKFCEIKNLEILKEYNKAADEWLKLKDMNNVIKNWELAQNYDRLGDYFFKNKKFDKALFYLEKSTNLICLAKTYEKLNKYKEAVQIYFKLEDKKKILSLTPKIKDKKFILQLFINFKDYYSAALIYEKDGDYQNAVKYFQLFAETNSENNQIIAQESVSFENKNDFIRAAVRFAALKNFKKAGDYFHRKNLFREAINYLKLFEPSLKLIDAYANENLFYEAGIAVENLTNDEDRKNCVKPEYFFRRHIFDNNHNIIKRNIDQLLAEGKNCEKNNNLEAAMSRYKTCIFTEGIINLYLKMDKHEEAIHYFYSYNAFDALDKYLKTKNNYDISKGLLIKLFDSSEFKSIESSVTFQKKFIIASDIYAEYLKKNNFSHIDKITGQIDSIHFMLFRHFKNNLEKLITILINIKNWEQIWNCILDFSGDYEFLRIISKIIETRLIDNPDDTLQLIAYNLTDKKKFLEELEKIEANETNIFLFHFTIFYRKAVDYYLTNKNISFAIWICEANKDFIKVAQIYEEYKKFEKAGNNYKNGKDFDNAVRCYEKSGNYDKIITMLFKNNQYNEAAKYVKFIKTPVYNRKLKNIINSLNLINEQGKSFF
ncbi:MAG TPA: UvrD-helicase domain-containing protein [bacterium]|nr:UvrD-helicase domain-containing protein [bacterium]